MIVHMKYYPAGSQGTKITKALFEYNTFFFFKGDKFYKTYEELLLGCRESKAQLDFLISQEFSSEFNKYLHYKLNKLISSWNQP